MSMKTNSSMISKQRGAIVIASVVEDRPMESLSGDEGSWGQRLRERQPRYFRPLRISPRPPFLGLAVVSLQVRRRAMLRNSLRGQRSQVSNDGSSRCGKIRPGKLWGRAASSPSEGAGGSQPGAGVVSGVGGPAPGPQLLCVREDAQLCPTLSDPIDCSLPGSSIHGIFQARVLEWGAIAFSLSFTISRSLLKLMSNEAVMLSNLLIFLSSPSPPAFNLSQHQGLFQCVSSSH